MALPEARALRAPQDFLGFDDARGVPLGALAARCQARLGEDFSTVRLFRSDQADALCDTWGARALALGERIAVHRREGDLRAPHGQRLLAHELAHVVQQRLGTARLRGAAAGELEAEARLAADAIGADREFRCRLADRAGVPRAWDYAGHYFTAYFVLLNHGIANARDIATCAWLPDQVRELDAATIGVNDWHVPWPLLRLPRPLEESEKDQNIRTYRECFERVANVQFADHTQYVHAIHRGLHCFGGDAASETPRRAQILRDEARSNSPLRLGLAIHAFGDSFAHRRPGGTTLYAPGFGHAAEGDAADQPWQDHKWRIYLEYFEKLSSVVASFPNASAPVVDAEEMRYMLLGMLRRNKAARQAAFQDLTRGLSSGERDRLKARGLENLYDSPSGDSETGCGGFLAQIALSRLIKDIEVTERMEAMPWHVYYGRNSGVLRASMRPRALRGVATGDSPELLAFTEIVQAAVEWSGIAPGTLKPTPFLESAEGTVQVDGPRTLQKGCSATYRVSLIGRPPPDSVEWSPGLQEEKDGLTAINLSRGLYFDERLSRPQPAGVQAVPTDRTAIFKATDGGGKGVIVVRCVWGARTEYGRAEISLTP